MDNEEYFFRSLEDNEVIKELLAEIRKRLGGIESQNNNSIFWKLSQIEQSTEANKTSLSGILLILLLLLIISVTALIHFW